MVLHLRGGQRVRCKRLRKSGLGRLLPLSCLAPDLGRGRLGSDVVSKGLLFEDRDVHRPDRPRHMEGG